MNRHHDDPVARTGARYELFKRIFIVFLIAYMVSSTVLDVVQNRQNGQTIQAVRDTQTEGSPFLKAIAAQQDDIERGTDAAVSSNNQLLDCLTPGGDCFKKSQKNSSDTVASLNEVTIIASACAAGFADRAAKERVIQTQQCVIERLAMKAKP